MNMCSVGNCGYRGNTLKVLYHMIKDHFGLTACLIRKSDIYYYEYKYGYILHGCFLPKNMYEDTYRSQHK